MSQMNQLKKPAKVYIFNHKVFNSKDLNMHQEFDLLALNKAFLKYNCEVTLITSGNMFRSTVKELESANLEEYSALVIIVLSPGKRFDKIYAKDSYYWLKSGVINPILRNATLENKPKFVFVQTSNVGVNSLFKGHDYPSNSFPKELNICNSTRGCLKRSYKSKPNFLQTMCRNLWNFGETDDIESTITRIRTENPFSQHLLPLLTSTMTKKYVFGQYMHNITSLN